MESLKRMEEDHRAIAQITYVNRLAQEAIRKEAEEKHRTQKMMQKAFKKEIIPVMRQDFSNAWVPLVQKQLAEWLQQTLVPALATCSPQAAALLAHAPPQVNLAAPAPNPDGQPNPSGIAASHAAHPIYGDIVNPISFGSAFQGPQANSSQDLPAEAPRDMPAEIPRDPQALFNPLEGLEALSMPNLGVPMGEEGPEAPQKDPEGPENALATPENAEQGLTEETLWAIAMHECFPENLDALPDHLRADLLPLLPDYHPEMGGDEEDSDYEKDKPNKKRRTE